MGTDDPANRDAGKRALRVHLTADELGLLIYAAAMGSFATTSTITRGMPRDDIVRLRPLLKRLKEVLDGSA